MILLLFFVNVLAFSLPLALFEIINERDKGWGVGLGKFWGRKFFEGGLIARVSEKHYLTLYHLVMFCLIVPLLLFIEYRFFKVMPLFFVASWFSIGVVEDFLWSAMNWYYPGSLRALLAGKIWWHTNYWTIGSIKLPRFYFLSNLWAALLLLAQYLIS